MRSRIFVGLCAVLWIAVGCADAEDGAAPAEFWPGTRYDPAIPTMQTALGHAPGERITRYEDLVRYGAALAASAPGRISVRSFGRSWEGRELVYFAVCSETNLRRLDDVGVSMRRLADPRVLEKGEADRLIAELPVLVWLTYGVHGDEISSPDAALLTAYHLVAARNDSVVEEILAGAIVFIVPSQNPDGRNRFVNHFEQASGLKPDADPLSVEHNEPWPQGRFNHYLFDMNRDWFAQTQPEIQRQASALRGWFPQVVVDLHEMGSDESYYFAPAANPVNPLLTKQQQAGWELIGRNNAKWFDRFGFDYFTREVFDAFYPGYGDSWPAFHGAVAMTYEQASPSGLIVNRRDGSALTYRDAVRRHFVASISTAQAAAAKREPLLRGFYEFRRTAIEEGRDGPVREYVLSYEGNLGAVDKLALRLAEQGIEVRRTGRSFRAGGEVFPAGSYVATLAQPAGRLLRNLLEPHIAMDEKFIAEQERRRKKNLPDEIYDVTAWSLPLLYGVSCVPVKEALRIEDEPLTAEDRGRGIEGASDPEVAFLVPWGSSTAATLLSEALEREWPVHSTDKAFRQGDRSYPRGSLIFKTSGEPAGAPESLIEAARRIGAPLVGTDTGWVEEGVNFGSDNVLKFKHPRIAIAWDEPTSPTSAGAARFVLEVQYGLHPSIVRTRDLAGPELDRFDTVVLPDGAGYDMAIGKGAAALASWVDRGGTLIAIGRAVSFLADKDVALLALAPESAAKEPIDEKVKDEAKPDEKTGRAPGSVLRKDSDYDRAIAPKDALPAPVAGVLLRAEVDPDHWITAGVPGHVNVLVQGSAMFTPIRLDAGVNAAHFAGPDEVLAGGFLWQENREQYAYKPFVVVQPRGRGFVVAFTADPNFRAYMDGLNILFLNAVLRGPAHATPAR